MAIAQTLTNGQHLVETPSFTPADRWDGYSEESIGKDFPDGKFQGYQLNWGTFDNQESFNPFQNQQYSGYLSNWGGQNLNGTFNAFSNEQYVGYSTNWGKYDDQPIDTSIKDIDMNTIVDFPKEKKTYYKLRGYNPLTQQFEAWVVSHNITGRPPLDGGLFDPDPGREPPNVERDVFKTPPSGNTLTDIIIVGRWIE